MVSSKVPETSFLRQHAVDIAQSQLDRFGDPVQNYFNSSLADRNSDGAHVCTFYQKRASVE